MTRNRLRFCDEHFASRFNCVALLVSYQTPGVLPDFWCLTSSVTRGLSRWVAKLS